VAQKLAVVPGELLLQNFQKNNNNDLLREKLAELCEIQIQT
jgi:hypothetical protein